MFAREQRRAVELRIPGLILSVLMSLMLAHDHLVTGKPGSLSGRSKERQITLRDAATRETTNRLARESVAAGEKLRAEWKQQSIRDAIDKYKNAYLYWQSIGSDREAAEAVEAAGDLHFVLSEYHQGLEAYNQALQIWRSLRNDLGITGTLTNIGYTYIYLGENQRALSYLAQASSQLNRLSPRLAEDRERLSKEAQLLNSTGEVYYSLSDVKKALDSFNRALALWTTAGDPKGEALAHLNLGYMNFNFGDLTGAREHYEESLSRWIAAEDKRGEALSRTAIGGIHSYLGEQQVALDLHNKALELFRSIGDRQGEAATLNGIGTVYEGLSKPQEALDNYERAMSIYHAIGNRDYEALGMLYLGAVNRALGANELALKYCHESLSLLRSVGNQRLETYALKDLAATYISSGQTDRALNQYRRILRLYRRFEDKRGQADTLSSIADIYSARSQTREARDLYRRALELVQAAQDRGAEISILYKLARSERAIGDTAQALSRMNDSIELIEDLRIKAGSPDLRAAYFASLRRHYEQYVDLLMEMDKRHPGRDFASQALFISERSRARSLLETLAEAKVDLRQGANPGLIEQADSLERLVDSTTEYQMRLLSGKHNKEDIEATDKEIRKLTTAYEEVQAQVREQSSLYVTLTQPKLLQVKEIQAELKDNNTLVLEYALGEERSYLWAITSESFAYYELPARSKLEAAAGEVFHFLTARQPVKGESESQYEERVAAADSQYWPRAFQLKEMLLGPVMSQLGTRRLIVVSEGALQYIPFEALPVAATKPWQASANSPANGLREADATLVTEHEIIYLQSASMLRALRGEESPPQSNSKGIAVLADPVFGRDDSRVHSSARPELKPVSLESEELQRSVRDLGEGDADNRLPRLPSTLEEAKMIVEAAPYGSTRVVTSFQASKAAVMRDDFSQFRILHFATHGIINDRHPERSGIVLSLVDEKGDDQSGFLRLSDVYKLKLDSDLIVLSACRSGLGKQVSGEGFVGLTRGFLSGGARSVVASLWKVDDEATAELMNHFYQAMLREELPPAAALQRAKQAMQRHQRWHHPYYWAAFVLQGEYRERVRIDSAGTDKAPVVAAILTTLFVLGLYVHRRRRKNRAGQ
jgi:CHAT domain-containing protein